MKAGYKQSEVGVIPDDWGVVRLDELVAYGPRNGYSGRSGKDARGTLTLSLAATTSGALILNDETVKRLAETIDVDSKLFLEPGDVLVQRSNTADLVGTTAIFDGPPGIYVYPDLMMRMRFRDEATAHWFWRYANSTSGRKFFSSIAAGSSGSMPKISGEKLRQMPVPLPPLSEQRAIAIALSDVDALLNGLDRLIAKKRDLKQAVMQQLLTGRTRLPGFQENWELRKLGEIAHITTGCRNNEDKVEDGEYPFFVRSEHVERINTYSHDREAILVPGEGRIGEIFHYIKGKFDVHQRVYAITQFHQDISARFVHLYMSMNFGAWAMQNTVKATVDSLRLPTFQSFEISVPPTKDEQTAIAEVLSDMDAEIAALEARRDKTRALKQGMMQELLTGRTRLI
ncbi:restriction endonuclease subunit S [Imhoffiella purpurea]|nr:restriction endonuclease subunit S [Imhoffiella purpurea]